MKNILLLFLAATCALSLVSCNKQPSATERQAEVDREVQRRLDAERQATAQQTIDQRQAVLDAREQALRRKENRTAAITTPAAREPRATPRPEVATTINEPDADSSYSTFYQRLDSYGAWIETSNYGFVFQPQVVSRKSNWRPYTDGHWVYTDVGWTWISSEPFGWATYHYGRWARLRSVGWVWVPGEEWAPAWVSWRRGNDFVGWAPLPPEARFNRQTGIHNWSDSSYGIGPEHYTFVPVQEFGGPQSAQAIVPPARNVTIIEQTTNVTNITYVNSTVVDRGPSFDDLRARSRHQIQKLKLERTQNFTAEQPVIRGEVVAMPTRDFRPAAKAARPARVQRTITKPTVERGWQDVKDPQVAQKLRRKIEMEATPPSNLPRRQPAEATETPAATAPPTPTAEASATAPSPIVRPATAAPATPSAQSTLSPQQETRRDRIQEKRRERRQQRQQQKQQQQQATPAPQESATAAPAAPTPATPAPKGRRPGPQPNQP